MPIWYLHCSEDRYKVSQSAILIALSRVTHQRHKPARARQPVLAVASTTTTGAALHPPSSLSLASHVPTATRLAAIGALPLAHHSTQQVSRAHVARECRRSRGPRHREQRVNFQRGVNAAEVKSSKVSYCIRDYETKAYPSPAIEPEDKSNTPTGIQGVRLDGKQRTRPSIREHSIWLAGKRHVCKTKSKCEGTPPLDSAHSRGRATLGAGHLAEGIQRLKRTCHPRWTTSINDGSGAHLLRERRICVAAWWGGVSRPGSWAGGERGLAHRPLRPFCSNGSVRHLRCTHPCTHPEQRTRWAGVQRGVKCSHHWPRLNARVGALAPAAATHGAEPRSRLRKADDEEVTRRA